MSFVGVVCMLGLYYFFVVRRNRATALTTANNKFRPIHRNPDRRPSNNSQAMQNDNRQYSVPDNQLENIGIAENPYQGKHKIRRASDEAFI